MKQEVYVTAPAEGPICDFCSGTPIYASYPAKTFTAQQVENPDGKKLNINSQADWAACKTCADLVDASQWDALLQRSVKTFRVKFGGMIPERDLRKFISDLHRQFRENRQQVN
jgi:hypothetical protein